LGARKGRLAEAEAEAEASAVQGCSEMAFLWSSAAGRALPSVYPKVTGDRKYPDPKVALCDILQVILCHSRLYTRDRSYLQQFKVPTLKFEV